MRIYLGADHAGFEFKEKLKEVLKRGKYKFEDLSPFFFDGDDYPDHAFKVAKRVAREKSLGILICGSGAGMAIAANKVRGIRAVESSDVFTAVSSKTDDDTNVLCLRSRKIDFNTIAKIASAWLKAKFKNRAPYTTRVKKIERYGK